MNQSVLKKVCNQCGKEKDTIDFYKDKRTADGFANYCISCLTIYKHEWYLKNKEKHNRKSKENRIKNPEYFRNYNKKYRLDNADSYKIKKHQRYLKDKKRILQKNKEWRTNNPVKYRIMWNAWESNQIKSNPNYKLLKLARQRQRNVLFNYKKPVKTLDSFMCSSEFLKKHIESQFLPGMTWENHGKNGWELDHILPCSFFDFNDPVEFYMCFRYQNLRPMWKDENLKKRDYIIQHPTLTAAYLS